MCIEIHDYILPFYFNLARCAKVTSNNCCKFEIRDGLGICCVAYKAELSVFQCKQPKKFLLYELRLYFDNCLVAQNVNKHGLQKSNGCQNKLKIIFKKKIVDFCNGTVHAKLN